MNQTAFTLGSDAITRCDEWYTISDTGANIREQFSTPISSI